MDRRALLRAGAAVATAALAGCPGDDGNGGNDDEPIDAEPADLLLRPDDFEDPAWTASAVETGDGETEAESETASREFLDEDAGESVVAQVWVFETVAAAREDYRRRREEAAADWDTRDVGVAVESFAYRGALSAVVFRDANVVGRVYHFIRYTDGHVGTATEYAGAMHDRWRD